MASCTSLQQNLRQGWQTREQTQGWQSALASNTSGYEDPSMYPRTCKVVCFTHATVLSCSNPQRKACGIRRQEEYRRKGEDKGRDG
eukprot:1161162-Pelagomonas_calceolata.AAC.1